MDYYQQAYIDSHTEYNQYLIAKIAAINLLHPEKLVKWSMSQYGIDVNICEDIEEEVKSPELRRCRCLIELLD